jgi:hypothetical protein
MLGGHFAVSLCLSVASSVNSATKYCNGIGQRVARQRLCKHTPTRNNGGRCVFCVRGHVTTTVGNGHMTCVCCVSVHVPPMDWLDSDHVTCCFVGCLYVLQLCKLSVQAGSEQLEVAVAAEACEEQVRSTEEYKKSACEDLTCDLKTLCVL